VSGGISLHESLAYIDLMATSNENLVIRNSAIMVPLAITQDCCMLTELIVRTPTLFPLYRTLQPTQLLIFGAQSTKDRRLQDPIKASIFQTTLIASANILSLNHNA
jgi:hypothetical protein